MKFSYTLFCCLILGSSSFAQMAGRSLDLLTDNQGLLVRPRNNGNVQGTPYLNEDWQPGILKITDEKSFKISKMRFDALMNRIEYEYMEKVFEPTNTFQEFVIREREPGLPEVSRRFRRGFPAFEENNEKTFYEVLYDGKVKLLKRHYIRINEYPEPLTTTRIKRFTKVPILYIYHADRQQFSRISKKDKASLLAALPEQAQALDSYLTSKRNKLKSEESLIDALKQYDTFN